MRLLNQSDVRELVRMEEVLAAVEGALGAHGRDETQMPPKVYLDFPDLNGDLRAMPAAMAGAAGLKWVNSHPANPERFGLPSVMGVYILSDPASARPLALMDATLLTAIRTGAAAAVASAHLAARTHTLGIIGCGVQADTLIEAHRVRFPDIEVLAADRSSEAARRVVERWGGRVVSVAEAAGADIVCTATPVRSPIVPDAAVQPGAHINAMGADAEGKQELALETLQRSRIFVDDWPQASHSGEINVAVHRGLLSQEDVAGSLCGVVAGAIEGRTAPEEITLFDSTGLAVQDLAVARILYAAAVETGRGQEFDVMG